MLTASKLDIIDKKSTRRLMSTGALAFAMFTLALPAKAQEEKGTYQPIRSNDVINRTHGGYSASQALYVKIKQAFIDEDWDKAIDLGKQAVDEEPGNLDAKVIYAEALYKKHKDDPKDTEVRNKCVKQWLIIHRLIQGDGWELSDKSQHTPFAYRFHTAERRDLVSSARLKELCGRPPKWREDDRKYLRKMLKSEKQVAGKIVKDRQ